MVTFYGFIFYDKGRVTAGLRISWDLNIISWVFDTLRDSLLASSHSVTFTNSLLTDEIKSSTLFPDINTFVSSANSIGNKIFDTVSMSLMYNKNKRGPKNYPWGTPQVMFIGLESASLKTFTTNDNPSNSSTNHEQYLLFHNCLVSARVSHD